MAMNRKEMEAVIAQGGSVLHQGRIYTKVEQLPSEADLAAGDEQAEAQASERLQKQIAELQAQVAKLQKAPAAEGGEKAPKK